METVEISRSVAIPLRELRFSFDQSPGPGGQNVNRVNTRVELRFRVADSRTLRAEQRQRLAADLGSRLTGAGDLIVRSSRFRSQARNRQDCLDKFAAIIRAGLRPPPPPRRQTRPSKASIARRIEAKKLKGRKKDLRRRPASD